MQPSSLEDWPMKEKFPIIVGLLLALVSLALMVGGYLFVGISLVLIAMLVFLSCQAWPPLAIIFGILFLIWLKRRMS